MRRISKNCYMLDMMTFTAGDITCQTVRKYEELPVKIYRADRDYTRKENDLCNSDILYIVLGYDMSKEHSVHIMARGTFLMYLMYINTIVCAMKVVNAKETHREDKAICNYIIAEATRRYARMANAQDGRKLTILSHADKDTNNYTQVSVWYHGIGQLYINPKTFTDDFLKFCLDCAADEDGDVGAELILDEIVICGVCECHKDMPITEFDEKVHDILVKMSDVR